MNEFDLMWRMKCVELAIHEQIEIEGKLSVEERLFVRARQIYDGGYEYGVDKWESIWKGFDAEEEKQKEIPKKETKVVDEPLKENHKKCPACGEQVNKTWKIHRYKKNSEPCGHEFKDEEKIG